MAPDILLLYQSFENRFFEFFLHLFSLKKKFNQNSAEHFFLFVQIELLQSLLPNKLRACWASLESNLMFCVQERIVQISPQEQTRIIVEKLMECRIAADLEVANKNGNISSVVSSNFCPVAWDGIVCWPSTASGHLVTFPCPNYFNNFRIDGVATRRCTENGSWYIHPQTNRPWTNYSQCTGVMQASQSHPTVSPLLAAHLGTIRLIYKIGYSVSLISLVVAISVILSFKKLRCPRNILHLNLFGSFIIRSGLALARDLLFMEGVGLSKDVVKLASGQITFKKDASYWECRLLMTCFNYATTANYSWIFVEGLYLHTLLFVSIFSESSSVHGYIIFGWISPLFCVVPWAIVRSTIENVLCWNTHPTPALHWIIKGPVLATIVLSFCFFVNVIRVLFTKLQAYNSPDSRRYRHRKLAKSALVLIPLFGVPYIVSIGWQAEYIDDQAELVKLYFEMIFNSFNGTLVAFLYCFLNGEVQSEIGKKWHRYRLVTDRGGSVRRRGPGTSNTYATRCGRSSFRSAANSTIMFDTSRDDQLSINDLKSAGGVQLPLEELAAVIDGPRRPRSDHSPTTVASVVNDLCERKGGEQVRSKNLNNKCNTTVATLSGEVSSAIEKASSTIDGAAASIDKTTPNSFQLNGDRLHLTQAIILDV